jgi:hypothetical protein
MKFWIKRTNREGEGGCPLPGTAKQVFKNGLGFDYDRWGIEVKTLEDLVKLELPVIILEEQDGRHVLEIYDDYRE